MWLVLKHIFHDKFYSQMFLFHSQNNGDVVKKGFNAIRETLLALTQHVFAIATSIVLMAAMKNLVVG